jgi:hypothetical protein
MHRGEIFVMFKCSVPTAQKTVTVTNALCEQNEDFFNVEVGGKYCNHCDIKG